MHVHHVVCDDCARLCNKDKGFVKVKAPVLVIGNSLTHVAKSIFVCDKGRLTMFFAL